MANHLTICVVCGCVCDEPQSEEDLVVELKQNFPGWSREDCVVVCDDCYNAVRRNIN